ncbi:hypothetical protein GCM10009682_08990 [Luedemannella flava]|uniref:Uncharacterized protein n=1 Tax=Luedemannella flava TaxID=349316 RepID=A0ABP4XRE7_9ACTN
MGIGGAGRRGGRVMMTVPMALDVRCRRRCVSAPVPVVVHKAVHNPVEKTVHNRGTVQVEA